MSKVMELDAVFTALNEVLKSKDAKIMWQDSIIEGLKSKIEELEKKHGEL